MKKLTINLILLSMVCTFGQGYIYIWKNNAIVDSQAISNDLKISFKTTGPSQAGLVAWYPFNGNANDESGNGNNCTVTNCTLVPDRFGKLNRAYSFDGSNSTSIITGTANPVLSLSQVTLSAWVKIKGQGVDFPRIIGVAPSNTSDEKYGMFLNSTAPPRAVAFYSYPSINWSQTLFLNDNVWHHLLTTFDGSTVKIFIDGILDKTVFNVPALGQFTSGHVVAIGGGAFLGNDRFDGALDDLRIYNRVLSDAEIQALFHETGN